MKSINNLFKVLMVAMLFMIASKGFGQSLIFCESVDKYGRATNPADTFDVDSTGGIISILVKPGHKMNTSTILYEIYAYDENGKVILNNLERQEVKPEWLFCWQRMKFADEGKYKINAYTNDNVSLGTGELYIKVVK